MLFQRLYNWIKYKTLSSSPSPITKNYKDDKKLIALLTFIISKFFLKTNKAEAMKKRKCSQSPKNTYDDQNVCDFGNSNNQHYKKIWEESNEQDLNNAKKFVTGVIMNVSKRFSPSRSPIRYNPQYLKKNLIEGAKYAFKSKAKEEMGKFWYKNEKKKKINSMMANFKNFFMTLSSFYTLHLITINNISSVGVLIIIIFCICFSFRFYLKFNFFNQHFPYSDYQNLFNISTTFFFLFISLF